MARNRSLVNGLLLLACSTVGCGILATDALAVMEVLDHGDGPVLVIASCNAAPEVTASDLLDQNRYEVEVRATTDWDRGNECADAVALELDGAPVQFEIVDTKSGRSFPFPPEPEAVVVAVDLDGAWQMTRVNGALVEVGVNTIEIPRITIEAGFLSGRFGCNGGGAELLVDGASVRGVVESTAELCSIPDGAEEMVPTEGVLTSMLSRGTTVQRDGTEMIWSDAAGNELVFELIG